MLEVEFAPGIDPKEFQELRAKFKPLYQFCYQDGLRAIRILSYDKFGAAIGFVHLQALQQGEWKSVFLRGAAVAILPVFVDGPAKYFMQVIYPRIPIGGHLNVEIPAGMSDGNGYFKGVAIRELEEETGMTVQQSYLIDLGFYYTSCEYCDEVMQLYALEQQLNHQLLDPLLTSKHGLEDEPITLKLAPFDEIYYLTGSSTLIAALRYYRYCAKRH